MSTEVENNITMSSLNTNEATIVLEAIGDWNNYGNETGFYTGYNMKNSPYDIETSKDYWYVTNICMSINSFATQTAVNAFTKETFIRNRENGVWKEWSKLGNGCDADTVDGKHASDFATTGQITNINTALNNKVDKITGKGLSTNDFTTSYKAKLDDIQAGAEVNVQGDWNETNTSSDAYIKNRPIVTSYTQFQNYIGTSPIDKYVDDTTYKNTIRRIFNMIANTKLGYIYIPQPSEIEELVNNKVKPLEDNTPANRVSYIFIKSRYNIKVEYFTSLSNSLSEIWFCTYNGGSGTSNWKKVNDGGNAKTLNGKNVNEFATAEDINEVKAKLKALKDFIQSW